MGKAAVPEASVERLQPTHVGRSASIELSLEADVQDHRKAELRSAMGIEFRITSLAG